MIEFHQLYYREDQVSKLYPFAIPYFNESLTPYFENSCIVHLVKASTGSKVSVCSWKLREKLKWYVGRPRELTVEVLESDYDVLSFTRQTKDHKMMKLAEVWHKGFGSAMQKMVEGIGKKWPYEVKIPVYQNHFAATLEIYMDYVTEYLEPAINFIENDAEMFKIAMQDSKYSELNKPHAISSEELMMKIGYPFYPLAPFLLERLFSVYIHNKNINVTWL
jgi:hypothetical protein